MPMREWSDRSSSRGEERASVKIDTLHAPVRVVDELGEVLVVALVDSHLQSVGGQLGVERGRGLSADDAPAEHV